MSRSGCRPYLPLLLLLCLVRTLLPEAWVLALHSHEHTTTEVAYAPSRVASAGRHYLTPRHQHCQTEQFYNVPFAAAAPLVLPQPRRRLLYRPLAVRPTRACPLRALACPSLRGPPVG